MTPNRKRAVHFNFYTTEEEAALIRQRMASSGIINLSAYLRKMAIDGYHVNLDLTDVRELVSLLRRCSNNLKEPPSKVKIFTVFSLAMRFIINHMTLISAMIVTIPRDACM